MLGIIKEFNENSISAQIIFNSTSNWKSSLSKAHFIYNQNLKKLQNTRTSLDITIKLIEFNFNIIHLSTNCFTLSTDHKHTDLCL